jgi:tetratricopeptide (TPR) repeat protein
MDSYALCPCGSGKKVKFCCQAILPEMAKIERLQENNQPRMALQLVDKLLKDHPQNPWLVNQRAMGLMADNRQAEARDTLVAFLHKQPDHPLSNGLLALVMTELEPLGQCKKVIHRAFLKSMAAEPRIVAILAGRLVDYYLTTGAEMAARQHMAVVLRLENEEERQRTLIAMVEMDSDTNTPYPFRGAHPLPHYQPAGELLAQVKKAQRLYIHACFSEAADLLDQVAQKDPESPELWHTIGLMRAWDGDEARAAAALHQAARLYQDFDRAVDLETVAQLLERRLRENAIAARKRVYEVESLSRLLTRLDNDDRLGRVPLMEEMAASGLSAAYEILDRTLPTASELEQLSLESVPHTIGQVMLVDRSEETSAIAIVSGLEGDRLAEAIRIFERSAGELATPQDVPKDALPDADVVSLYSRDEVFLSDSPFFPPQTPANVRQRLRNEFVQQCLQTTWPETPQQALEGKSPLQAADDERLKVALTAALQVFDSFLDRRGLILDAGPLRERLRLPVPEPIVPSAETDLNTLSVTQLQRLQTSGLSDELFERVMQRALIVKHSGLSYRLLSEFLTQRPQLVEQKAEEAEQAHVQLAEICSRSLREEEALDWLERGFQLTKSRGGSFEKLLMWKMRELSLRSRDTTDPAFKEVLLELWNHYGGKLPAVRARLEGFVRTLGIEAPWENAILTPQLSASGSVWTAESDQSSSSEKKLWLPD